MGQRILGIDYGERRIGLAISDELGLTAQPLETIENRGIRRILSQLRPILEEKAVGEIVVGLPRSLSGALGPKAQETMKFVDHLRQHIALPVSLWDERLTTAQAEKAMIEADLSRARRKKRLDAAAAQLMLQNFLDARRYRARAAEPESTDAEP